MRKVILTAMAALTLMACSKEEITPDNAATAVSDNTPITIDGVWHLKEKVINGIKYPNDPVFDKDWEFKSDTMTMLFDLGDNNPTFLLDNKNQFPLNETINFTRVGNGSGWNFSRDVIRLGRNEMHLEYLLGTDNYIEVWVR